MSSNDWMVGKISFGKAQTKLHSGPQPGNPGTPSMQWMEWNPPALPGETVIGTCSKCRGPVCVPSVWGGIIPPTPTCRGCGATKKQTHGPIIEME